MGWSRYLRRRYWDDERARERFVREARIAANLHHQHIVPIHDVGVHDGIAYIGHMMDAYFEMSGR